MAQHFLLSAAARTLSLKTIFSEGEDAAYRRFRRLRWPDTDGAPVCPACGCLDIYDLTTRRRFKCAACHHQFSVTSGTIFASRKLSFVDLLGAICLFVNASKGLSAVQLSRDLDVQYKTAFVLMHKLREVMAGRRGIRGSAATWKWTALRSAGMSGLQMPAKTASIAACCKTAAASVVSSSRSGSAADQPSREHSCARPRAWPSPGRGSHQDRRSRPMRSPIGTFSSRRSMFTASTIPAPTAVTASTPIWLRASLPGSGAWSAGSITRLAAAFLAPMRHTPPGWRIIAVRATARSPTA